MNTLRRRLARLETPERAATDPAIRRWLGIELSEAEQAELDARPPAAPMTAEQTKEFETWWHNPSRGECPH